MPRAGKTTEYRPRTPPYFESLGIGKPRPSCYVGLSAAQLTAASTLKPKSKPKSALNAARTVSVPSTTSGIPRANPPPANLDPTHPAPVPASTHSALTPAPAPASASAPATALTPASVLAAIHARGRKPTPKKFIGKPGQVITEELWLDDQRKTRSRRLYAGLRRARDDGDVALIVHGGDTVVEVMHRLAALYEFRIASGNDAMRHVLRGQDGAATLDDVIMDDDTYNERRLYGTDLVYRLKIDVRRG